MRTSETFVIGAIAGALAVWLGGREMGAYIGEKTRGVRAKAAAGIRTAEDTAGRVLDQGGNALRCADEFLQDTKEHVGEALQAGQEAISPGSTARKA
jgi:gas vesicle protein